jgi:hypothetical protein
MRGTYKEIEEKLATAYAAALLGKLWDSKCKIYPPPTEDGTSPTRNVHCLWRAAMALLTGEKIPHREFDADIYQAAEEYVDSQLHTMGTELSPLHREHVVHTIADYPQNIRDWGKRTSKEAQCQ